ncbi:MAG TPA: YbdD/YjiX family protein [Nitrosospira sp.]
MLNRITQAGRYVSQSLRLMVGVPEYDIYVMHMRDKHPGQPVMSYEKFFRERQEARYDGKVSRCC